MSNSRNTTLRLKQLSLWARSMKHVANKEQARVHRRQSHRTHRSKQLLDGTLLRCNDIVITWIQNSLSTNIKCSTFYAETVKQLWEELEHRHAQQNTPRIYKVKQVIAVLVQNGNTISAYFSKLKTLFDELLN